MKILWYFAFAISFLYGLICFSIIFDNSYTLSERVIFLGLALLFGFLCYKSLRKAQQKNKKDVLAEAEAIKKEANRVATEITKEANEYAESIKKEAAALNSSLSELKTENERLEKLKKSAEQDLAVLNVEFTVESTNVQSYQNLESLEIKNRLLLLESEEKDMIKNGKAVTFLSPDRQRYKDNERKLLRSFNAEVGNIIDHLTLRNIDASRSKILKAFEINNKLYESDSVELSSTYLSLKLERLTAVYAYLLKVNEERETKKAIREQMIEEEKVRREIEREKQKIAKDHRQFSQEVQRLISYMQKSQNDAEKQLYINKIQELEEKIKELEENEKTVLDRENNAKAGFVYVISNIGSFGDHVYKIGMTRRLEPMERIEELSSASVPFPFDVHAMIFAEDAPALEAMLHQHFKSQQANKVNSRKEFFHVDLEEIKRIVLEKFNNTVQFVEVPEATEYRETLRLEAKE